MTAEEELRQYVKERQTIITVAGNIGLGKTTTTELIAHDLQIAASYELANSVLDQDLLWRFIRAPMEEKPEHCYTLELDLLEKRLAARRRMAAGGVSFIEDRTPEEDPAVMHRLFLRHGFLRQDQYDQLQQLARDMYQQGPFSQLMLVLQGPAEIARAGILQRGREGEAEAWQLERDLRPLEDYFKDFPFVVGNYGLHQGPILEINRELMDPRDHRDRERIYGHLLFSLSGTSTRRA